jgi:hypothetical protein
MQAYHDYLSVVKYERSPQLEIKLPEGIHKVADAGGRCQEPGKSITKAILVCVCVYEKYGTNGISVRWCARRHLLKMWGFMCRGIFRG